MKLKLVNFIGFKNYFRARRKCTMIERLICGEVSKFGNLVSVFPVIKYVK